MKTTATLPYAGLWRRIAAATFDGGLGLTISLGITFIFGVVFGTAGLYSAVAMSALLWWLYSAGMESSDLQATLGGRIFSTRVSSLEGGRIGFWRASLRQAVRIGAVLAVLAAEEFAGGRAASTVVFVLSVTAFAVAAALPRRQALFDLAAKTVVTTH
ncbi:RDD family protein [Methylibium petroleiphilum]|uniref:RDD domain-containing protein n=1 Tax=Methylibium petroleiphilum (strain ATCC BAA-1232 / LMG 22953 / PM1) TaxID=420662 RepID=A2SMV5_METPP|nr:RDD family protein [Methylibium petroleiphilum]ABM96894.1 hypothetical protein Mpe_B0115 [Methylibium petroleiphilum PM1]